MPWLPDALAAKLTEKDVAELGAVLPTVSRTGTTLTVGATLPFNAAAGKDRLRNGWAGHWTAKAGATKVRKGATVTFEGRLDRADWDKGVWAGNAGQSVQLQFKNSHGAWVTKAVAKTSATGAVNISARDYASGSWRVFYNGNVVSGAAVSGSSYVAVK